MNNIKLAEDILEKLNVFYPPGLYEWLYKNKKRQYDKIVKVERDLHGVISYGTEEETKELLTEYWKLHKTAIDEYNKSNETVDTEVEINMIREKILEDRASI